MIAEDRYFTDLQRTDKLFSPVSAGTTLAIFVHHFTANVRGKTVWGVSPWFSTQVPSHFVGPVEVILRYQVSVLRGCSKGPKRSVDL